MSYNLTDVRGELTQPQNNYIILEHRMKRFIYRGVEQLVARRAHNPEVVGSSPSPATIFHPSYSGFAEFDGFLFVLTLSDAQ